MSCCRRHAAAVLAGRLARRVWLYEVLFASDLSHLFRASRNNFEKSQAILQCRADAVLAFLYLGLGQADDSEIGQSVGEMHLDGDQRGVHPRQTATV